MLCSLVYSSEFSFTLLPNQIEDERLRLMLKTQTNLNQNRSILFSCLQALKTLSAAVAQTPPVVITKCIQMVGVSCFFRHLLTKRLRTESISTIATPNPWRGTRYGAAAMDLHPQRCSGHFSLGKELYLFSTVQPIGLRSF